MKIDVDGFLAELFQLAMREPDEEARKVLFDLYNQTSAVVQRIKSRANNGNPVEQNPKTDEV